MELASVLEESGLPRWPPGALRAAWDACDDAATMIAVLLRGGVLGVFEIDGHWQAHGPVSRWLFRMRSGGRYDRVDVRPEDGPAGVRACFPDFPDDWRAHFEARLATLAPLKRIAAELRVGYPPTIDAAAREAWSRCDDAMAMLGLLVALGHREAALAALPVPGMTEKSTTGLRDHERNRRGVRALRRAFPDLPRPK